MSRTRATVRPLFWWFMVVSQHPNGTLTAATQGLREPGAVRLGRQQIGVTTGLRAARGSAGRDRVLERRAVKGRRK